MLAAHVLLLVMRVLEREGAKCTRTDGRDPASSMMKDNAYLKLSDSSDRLRPRAVAALFTYAASNADIAHLKCMRGGWSSARFRSGRRLHIKDALRFRLHQCVYFMILMPS